MSPIHSDASLTDVLIFTPETGKYKNRHNIHLKNFFENIYIWAIVETDEIDEIEEYMYSLFMMA